MAKREEKDRDKPLFMISVVSELLGVHPQTLRLYEREGFIRPRRTRGNTRLYSERDVEEVRRVLHLTRDLGVNLACVEVILEMRRRMETMQDDMEAKIERFRREIMRELERQQAKKALVKVERGITLKRSD